MASSELIDGPSVEPVDAAEAMRQLRIDDEANAPQVETSLREAREMAEHVLGRALITQTRRLSLLGWPASNEYAGAVLLDYPPIQDVTEVRYWNGEQWAVLPPDQYTLERLDRVHHLLMPAVTWPALGARPGVRVRITYTAGFGDAGEDVPEAIRQWIVARAGIALDDPRGDKPVNEFINRRLDAWRTRL